MKIRFYYTFIVSLFLFLGNLFGQCPNNGQNPLSAFPVCASTTFTQNIVPTCPGQNLPVPPCSGSIYTDKNPYYYKFTSFQSTQLVFTIKPLNLSDDYDWQLFDVTGKNPNNIYTDASMYVCCNWSGNQGVTGTNLTASNSFSCEGNTSNYTKAPNLIQGHDYLLMISHFDDAGQSGYNLSFQNASGFVDTTAPSVKSITANCVANKILVKLNKKMKCSSISNFGSEFNITGNPTITSSIGFGCTTNFDTDSIIISLASPLPAGSYTAKIQRGTDGNTIVDNCGNEIPVNQSFDFTVVGAAQPTPMDSIIPLACNPNTLQLVFKAPIRCNSVAVNGSDFIVTGPSTVNILSASIVCNNSLGSVITVNLASPITVAGNYTITLKSGNDGNTLLNQCDVATLAGSTIIFPVYVSPNPAFTYVVNNETCKADTLTFTHNVNNSVNKWQWTFDGTPTTSTLQTQQVVYNSFTTRVVKLRVSNPACTDSITQNIPIADHLIIPKFVASRDTTCPNNPETFTDSSKGKITSWKWDFANGQTSTSQTPPTQIYPVLPINKLYATKLVVTNQIGCIDSITKDIFVRGTIPTVFDSIIPPICAATEVKVYFKQAMICGSVSTDGSEFIISGAAPNSITAATINCVNGVGTTVTLTLAQPLITGNYTLQLKPGTDGNTIINDCGIETLVAAVAFNSFGHINPAFTYTTKLGCKSDTITYNHSSNNAVNQWQWIFDGNPATSNVQNPTVAYTDFTKRDVQLVVSNGVCFDTLKQSLPIVDHSIQAKFSMPDTTCGNGGTIFIDSSKGIITNWYWNFGAGLTSSFKNPSPVNYPLSFNFKDFPVNLVVKNIVGCFDTAASRTILVKPSAAATMDKMNDLPCSPDSFVIHFNAPMLCNTVALNGSDFSITGPSSPTIVSAGIFNCNNSFGRDVVVKLNAPLAKGGYYKLNLKKGTDGNTIINDCGIETEPSFIGFVAFTKVNASFTYIDKINCVEDTLFLLHTVDNDENKWSWIINGTLLGNVNNFTLPYTQSDVKNVTLVVANPVCSDTSKQTINLTFDKLKANFILSQNIVCPIESVDFRDTSKGNIVNWDWSFGNGQTSIQQNPPTQSFPIQSYPVNTGSNYEDVTARLIVSNTIPCYDTAYQTIRVTSNCLIQVPSAFTPNGDGLNDFLYPLNAYKARELSFRVFNRLGRIVFETSSFGAKWGGNFGGEKQPSGTYIWILDYTDKDTGRKISLNGTTVLIR
jgi:gliding motility-associated-like protein